MSEQVKNAILRRRHTERTGDVHIAVRCHGVEIGRITAHTRIGLVSIAIHSPLAVEHQRKMVRQGIGNDIAGDRQQAYRAGRP